MNRFRDFDRDRRTNSFVQEIENMLDFIRENHEISSKNIQIKIKDPENAIFLGDSKFGPVALNKEYFNDVRTLIVGQPGSGKSYLTRCYIEQLLDEGSILVFVFDPEGEWITLRQKYDILILGKNKEQDHCDIEINENNFEKV